MSALLTMVAAIILVSIQWEVMNVTVVRDFNIMSCLKIAQV